MIIAIVHSLCKRLFALTRIFSDALCSFIFVIGSWQRHKVHMWLEGCPNPHKMEQSWECTFLEVFSHMNTKWASKKDFIIGLQNYQLVCTANPALVGLDVQKSVLPTLFHFVRVRAAIQPHVP